MNIHFVTERQIFNVEYVKTEKNTIILIKLQGLSELS